MARRHGEDRKCFSHSFAETFMCTFAINRSKDPLQSNHAYQYLHERVVISAPEQKRSVVLLSLALSRLLQAVQVGYQVC